MPSGRFVVKHKRKRWCKRCGKLYETELIHSNFCPECNRSTAWKNKKDKIMRMV